MDLRRGYKKSSITGFKNAILHLRDGHPLGIFPTGEVSTYKDGNSSLINHGKKLP
jgi:hypothetical protein